MPDMFGRPSQHLLPSCTTTTASAPVSSDTAPIQPAPVSFKDFRFNSIGKQPGLLSRISLTQPDNTVYHSSSPSPTSTPLPSYTTDAVPQSRPSSRPTLLQQLAGSDISSSMNEASKRKPSGNQSNRSLASRIQMNDERANDAVSAAPSTVAARFPSPPRVNNASLIPPVEVLPQPNESSPSTPVSLAPPLEGVDVHSPTSSMPLINTMTARSSRVPTPSLSTGASTKEPAASFPSFAVVDAMRQDLQHSPSTVPAMDFLVARRERLQAIHTNLANLASSLPPPLSQSSSPDIQSVPKMSDSVNHHSTQSQNSSNPIVLHHPYTAIQSSGRPGLMIGDVPPHTGDPSIALVHSSAVTVQEHQVRRKAVIEAVQNLNSALSAVHLSQIDSENTLASQKRALEEERATFEKTKRDQEVAFLKEFREFQQKCEELNAREASLISLEQECKAREVARKAALAKRQAQEDERKAAEAKRTQAVQEQITAAMTDLKEIEALKAKCRLEQLETETLADDLPTEPQEGMAEEEIAAIKSRNDLLRAVKHLRRMHSDKVQKLAETCHTLRRLGRERKLREAEEAERRRVAEERLRAQAEAERARQALEEKQRQAEAQRKHQEVENNHLRIRPSAELQPRVNAQLRGLGRTDTPADDRRGRQEGALQPKDISDVAGSRAVPDPNPFSSDVAITMSVDEDREASTLHRTVPPPDVHTTTGSSQDASSQPIQTDDKLTSGSVMLARSTSKVSAGSSLKPPAKPVSLSTSNYVAENASNPAGTPPAVLVSKEGERGSSFPAQLAAEFNRVHTDSRPTPERRPGFPRTPRSRTLLDATLGGSEEFHIGPITGVSPTQQNVNLRHLKRNRSRIEENDSGDRSVRTDVKDEENTLTSVKKEEYDDQSWDLARASLPMNPLASLPSHPTIIPPPRPQKRHAPPGSQPASINSFRRKSNELSIKREAQVNPDQTRQALPRGSPSSQAVNASVQLPVPSEIANSLLLSPVHADPQPPEPHLDAAERPNQDRAEDTSLSEPGSATLSHEIDGDDLSRRNRRSADDHPKARNGNKFRRLSHHYSPPPATSRSPFPSPTLPQRYIDTTRHTWESSNGHRAEAMRATSPTAGRKRPFESNNNDRGHRGRRERDDVWTAEGDGRDWADSYRVNWDRRVDSESDGRRAAYRAYRAPPSPPDRMWSYPSDGPRAPNDNRTHASPFREELATQTTRWEPSYRRSENDDSFQRYQLFAPGYNAVTDLYHADDRINQSDEPTLQERMDPQTDPALLMRMNTQRIPPSTNPRGRGRSESNRGRGDHGRGRGRGAARGTPALLERMTSVPNPPSLGERLS